MSTYRRYRIRLRDRDTDYVRVIEDEWPVADPDPDYDVVGDAEADINIHWTEGQNEGDRVRARFLYGDHRADEFSQGWTGRILAERAEWEDGQPISPGNWETEET
jgi:hypothetical protein